MLALPLLCSGVDPREQEQLHPVLQQLGLAGEQAGEAGVFLRYAHYHSHTRWGSSKTALWADWDITKLSGSFDDNPALLNGDSLSLKRCKMLKELYRYLCFLNI